MEAGLYCDVPRFGGGARFGWWVNMLNMIRIILRTP